MVGVGKEGVGCRMYWTGEDWLAQASGGASEGPGGERCLPGPKRPSCGGDRPLGGLLRRREANDWLAGYSGS